MRGRWVAGTSLILLAVVMLGMVLQMTVLAHLRHARAQQIAAADFRAVLANAEAPTGQLDRDGKLYPLGASIAVLRIPAIGLDEIVFSGTTSAVLMDGPGHRRVTPLPGQAGTSEILGRRAAYGGPFRDLALLSSGDEVTVVTGQGVHRYQIMGVRHAGDLAPPPLSDGQGRLTLVTADGQPFLPEDVLRVDARLVSEVQPAAGRPLTVVPAAEHDLAGEPEAWMTLVLWGQALLIAAVVLAWARRAWGKTQTWLVAVPVLGMLGIAVSDQIGRLLPNLM